MERSMVGEWPLLNVMSKLASGENVTHFSAVS